MEGGQNGGSGSPGRVEPLREVGAAWHQWVPLTEK